MKTLAKEEQKVTKVAGYVCPYCSAEFDTLNALKSHIAAEHQEGATLPTKQPEETFIKGMGLGGHGGYGDTRGR